MCGCRCGVIFQEFSESAFRNGFSTLIEFRQNHSVFLRDQGRQACFRSYRLTKEREEQTRALFRSCGRKTIPLNSLGFAIESVDSRLTPSSVLAMFNELTLAQEGQMNQDSFCQFVGWALGKRPKQDFDSKLEELRRELTTALAEEEQEEQVQQQGPTPLEMQRGWMERALRVKGCRRLYSLRGVDVTPVEFDQPDSEVQQVIDGVHGVGMSELVGLLAELLELYDPSHMMVSPFT